MNSMDDYARLVRDRVKELECDERDLLARTGLSAHEFYDIQRYPDELAEAVPLSSVRRLMAALNWNLLRLVGAGDGESAIEALVDVRTSRLKKGLSVEALADQLGFDTAVVMSIESEISTLDQYPLVFALQLANVLEIAPSSLLAALERGAST